MVRTMTVVVTTREWQLQESTLGISSMQGVKGVSLTMLIASKPSAVFLLTQSTRKISSQVLTAIIFHFDRQLLGNKTSFTPCSIYILLIFNKFYKFWMSCACTRLCTKNKPKRAHSGPQTELISHGGQGFIIRPVSGNRRPLVPVYRTGLTGYR